MPVINHAITLYIGGEDKTQYLIKDSVFMRLSIGNKSDVAEFKVKNFNPVEYQQVEIKVNGTTLFGGYIIRKTVEVLGVSPKTVIWSIECKDWSLLLDKVNVTENYVGMSDSAIVDALFDTYIASTFNSTANVSTLDADLDIAFNNVSLRDALDQLAGRVGANWSIAADKAVYWFNPSSPSSAAFNIDTDAPNNTTTFDILRNSLKYSVDATSIVNRIVINGGTKSTGTQLTEAFSVGTDQHSFGEFAQLIDSIHYVDFVSESIQYLTYGSFIGYQPDDKLISEGGTYAVVVSADRKRILVENPSTGSAPTDGSIVDVVYYYKEAIALTVNDTDSQARYGVFSQSILNRDFTDETQAQEVAQSILDQYSTGRESLQFSITRYGLLPGTLLGFTCSDIEVAYQVPLALENLDILLLESGDSIILQSLSGAITYLIQEVEYTATVTNNNEFMIVCNVTVGKYIRDLVDSLSTISDLKNNVGSSALEPSMAKLSNISSNLGEIVVGRANFTDGGTARFNWGTPNGASGAVIGLEDRDSQAYGAVYIYDNGSVKAKLGRLDDQPLLGTVQPSGWGLYTQNGYFTGIVAASTLLGNTISGNQITGGTITGGRISGGTIVGALISGDTISGGTVTGALIVGGTIATSTPPINSSNPGVQMDATGLYGYGSAGLTFRLSSDPAIKPYFSSGTILDTIYEINTAAVLRTGTTNPRIQIDNSGIFAYNSAGDLKFSVDVTTGRLTASDGIFSGSISASQVSGGTISAPVITGALVSAGAIQSNTLSSNSITSGTITGNLITAGTVTGNIITAGTVIGNLITAGTITSNQITSGTITGNVITGGTVSVVSGSVTATDSGLQFITGGSYVFGGNNNIKWLTSGSVVADLSSYYASSLATVFLSSGNAGAVDGAIAIRAYNAGLTDYSGFYINKDQVEMYSSLDLIFTARNNVLEMNKAIVPTSSAAAITLGDTTRGFRYLYMVDSAGVEWRIEVTTGGFWTITAA